MKEIECEAVDFSMWVRVGFISGFLFFERSNKTSGTMKCFEFRKIWIISWSSTSTNCSSELSSNNLKSLVVNTRHVTLEPYEFYMGSNILTSFSIWISCF
jgi:hypothetical protein